MVDYDLKGKTYVVTGAAQGIGAAIARALLDQGAYVYAIDLQDFDGSELSTMTTPDEQRNSFAYHKVDASDLVALKKIFDNGQKGILLSGLVNNAGLLGLEPERTLEQWKRYIDAHAKTAFVMTEVCYPLMKNGGSIVNMGSIELEMCSKDVVLYTAGKGAVLGLTIGYSVTLAPFKIRVNMVSPGNVNTKKNIKQYQDNPETRKVIEKFEYRTPLKRSVYPMEVANEVLFLLSDLSSGTTGQNRIVDCGYTRALWDDAWLKPDS